MRGNDKFTPPRLSCLQQTDETVQRPHRADEVEEPEPEPQARSSEGYGKHVGSAEAE